MKRTFFITLVILSLLFCEKTYANTKTTDHPTIKFNGTRYSLYYSIKSKELNGYLNEYYKTNEGYTNWSELIALQHFPTAYYPIEYAKDFKAYLESMGCNVNIMVNEETNSAIIDFIIVNKKKLPIIAEYNIFKYVKSPICGTVGLQFAQRYILNNPLNLMKVQNLVNKNRKKLIKKFDSVSIPTLTTIDIDKGVYLKTEEPEQEIAEKINQIEKEEINEKINIEEISTDKLNEKQTNTEENKTEMDANEEEIELESELEPDSSSEIQVNNDIGLTPEEIINSHIDINADMWIPLDFIKPSNKMEQSDFEEYK